MRADLLLLLVVTALALVAGLAFGAVALPPAAVWRALVDGAAPNAAIVRDLRLPRVLLAFLVGGGLAVSGAALQAVVRNALAEPYLLGIAGGAGLGAVAAIAAGATGLLGVTPAAFVGALAASALVYRLSLSASRRLEPLALVLAGVVVGLFCGALMSAVLVVSDAAALRNAFQWLLGGFALASWSRLGVWAAWAAVPLAVITAHARALDLLALGDESAQHLGADVTAVRGRLVAATSLLTAACVAAAGLIGFVGLVIPHAVRHRGTALHRTLLPVAFVAGGTFLVAADLLARTLLPPVELPIGAITALVGVPVFSVILRRRLA